MAGLAQQSSSAFGPHEGESFAQLGGPLGPPELDVALAEVEAPLVEPDVPLEPDAPLELDTPLLVWLALAPAAPPPLPFSSTR